MQNDLILGVFDQLRKICVFTGTRADYGHLFWLMKEIEHDVELQLQLLVSGSHLSPEFGLTVGVIEEDGFVIDEKVEMLLSADSAVATCKAMGLGLIGYSEALSRLQPDLLIILGDRFEAMAAAQAALVARVPIAHIYGGETSEGAIDEAIRHSITKMATYHFTAAEAYRKRVIQLGEHPDCCFNYGAPGLDHLSQTRLLDREELEEALKFKLGRQNFLVTYHPATLANEDSSSVFNEILAALQSFPEAHFVLTMPNADPHGRGIIEASKKFAAEMPERACFFSNLGQVRYLSIMKQADAVIGNSSSGLDEAPAQFVPTVNIGERQKGRLRSDSVIDVEPLREKIVAGIEQALSSDFKAKIKNQNPAYGSGDVSKKIVATIKKLDLAAGTMKEFYDIDFQEPES